ncbi:MAG TPA: Crp/Fnr family transcriptional regulator [Allosphingosinicella sp.]|jgi:CRP-like cAMP-binding protein
MIGEALVKHLGLIGHLDKADEAALLGIKGEIRDVARDEDLLREGERPGEAVVVLAGFLQRYTLTAQGERQVHSFYMATDTPCLETLHIDYMDNNLGAVVPSRVGAVAHAELFRVMDLRPNLLALIWRETLIQGAIFREWLMRNSRMLAHVQLAHFFCEMLTRARAAGIADGDSCELPLTQQDLADVLGMTAVHVNRTLMMLRSAGLIEFRAGRLIVRNWDELVEIAEFDPHYLHLRRPAQ